MIETSGLALPQPLLRAFAWPEVRARVTVDGVVTLVDAQAVAEGRFASDEAAVDRQRKSDEGLDHETPLAELFEDQLSCADLVVMSKSDLVTDEQRAEVTTAIDAHKRKAATVVISGETKPPVQVLLGLGAQAETDALNRRSHHDHHHHDHDHDHHDDDHHHHDDHDHDDFESFTVSVSEIADPAQLADRVAEAGALPGVLRIKGFAPVSSKPMRLVVQAVGPRVEHYFDRPWTPDEDRFGQLVVIGLSGLDKALIVQRLNGQEA